MRIHNKKFAFLGFPNAFMAKSTACPVNMNIRINVGISCIGVRASCLLITDPVICNFIGANINEIVFKDRMKMTALKNNLDILGDLKDSKKSRKTANPMFDIIRAPMAKPPAKGKSLENRIKISRISETRKELPVITSE